MRRDARLNERHYGALQGVRKDDRGPLRAPVAHSTLPRALTEAELELARRSMRAAPPAMAPSHPHFERGAPVTESLADCQARVLRCFDEAVAPALEAGGATVLVAAHANTLRALIAALDGVPDALVPKIFVPNAVPCCYEVEAATLEPTAPRLATSSGGSHARWLLSAENYDRLADKIGVKTLARNIFEAWDANGDGLLDVGELRAGLRATTGGDDVAVAAGAGAILADLDEDGDGTISRAEFEARAEAACRRFVPSPVGLGDAATRGYAGPDDKGAS